MVTLDASVLVAADAADERGHHAALEVLRDVVDNGLAVHEPTLAIVEVAAAIARRTGNEEVARRAVELLAELPGLTMHPLDETLAVESAAIAANLRLRAADAVYVAVARRTGAVLVTLDHEQLERARDVVDVTSPEEWSGVDG